MMTGTYRGPINQLGDRRAILVPAANSNWVKAQFNFHPPEMNENDDGDSLNYLCFGWHPFPRSHFEIDEEEN